MTPDVALRLQGLSPVRRGKKPRKSYIGRTNRNGTVVARATHDRLAPELVEAAARRAVRRARRRLKANPNSDIAAAPRHIRERVGG